MSRTIQIFEFSTMPELATEGTVYEIRKGSMLGPLLATVRVCEDHGRCTEPDMGGRGAIEVAALRGASASQVRRHFGGPNRRNGYGINRETGTPGVSGIFSLWKEDGSHGRSNVGSIHVSKA